MPIYVYQCLKCEEKMEVIQKVNESSPATCIHCQASGNLKKIISPISSRKVDRPTGNPKEHDIPPEAYQPLTPVRNENLIKDKKTGHYVEAEPNDPKLEKTK